MTIIGRPTSYNEDSLTKTREYIALCIDDIPNKKVKIPTIEGLAVYLNVNKTTIYEWESKHEEFSNVIDTLRNNQGDRLLNNGLAGTYNPTIAKVLLTKHGYREGIEQTGKDGKDLSVNITTEQEKLAKEYEEKLKKGI